MNKQIHKKTLGVYPGTFDPVTAGHIDIIERALMVVDKLIVGVAIDSGKDTLFSCEERIELLHTELSSADFSTECIKVTSFNGLLVNFAKQMQANLIIRGIRAISDFEYEFQMSCMNSKLDSNIQTIFLPASEKVQLVSSKLVKEVVRLGGKTYGFASENIEQKIIEKFSLA